MADPDERGGAEGPANAAPTTASSPPKPRKPDTGLFGFDDALLAALEDEDDDELLLTGPAEPPSLTLGSLDLAAGLDLDGDAAEGEDLADADLEDDDLWGRLDDSAAPSPATPPPTPMLGAPLERPTPLGPPPVGSPPGESDAPAPSSVGLDTLPPLDSGIEAAFGASSPPAPFATLALGPVALDAADAALAETGVLAHPVVPPSDGAVAVGGAGEDVFALDLGDASDPLDGSDELDDLEELDEADLEALDDEPGLSSGPPPPPEPDLSPAPVPSEAEPVVIADMPAREPVAPSGARSDGGGVANAPPDLRVPDGPGPLLDAAAIPPRGLRLLVTLPPVDPCVPGEVFPEHSPAAPDWSWGEGAGVAVALPKPQSELPRAAAFDGLLAALRRAIEGEADPERLASLAFGYAAVAVRVHGDVEVGLAAARAAMANAPTFSPARRLLHELLAMQGRTDERLALLERGDATALDEAGHLAWRTGDAERAHSDWGWAAEYDPTALGPMLSSLLALSARPGVRDERAVLQWALARAQSPALWQALALEQLRLNMRDEPGYADAWAEDGLQRLDPSPALGALIEWHALTQGNAGLLAAALELRPNGLEGPAAAVARAWAAEANGDHPGFGHAVDGARGARPGSLGWLAARARLLGHRAAEAAALAAASAQMGPDEVRHALALRQARLSAEQGALPAARAHVKAVLAADPTHTPALRLAARLDDDAAAAHPRAVAEIEALEASLADAQGAAREALVDRLVDRYLRVVLALEGPLEAPEHAVPWAKRALALAPAGLDAVLVLERHFARGGDWGRVAALALGRVERADDAEEQRGWLHLAAELFLHRLGAPGKALRVYQRLVRLAPDDLHAQRALVDVALAAGDWAAAVAAQRAVAQATPPAQRAVAFGVVGRLAELAGDVGSALAAYQAALTADPADAIGADGVVRLAAAGGASDALLALAKAPTALRWSGLAAVQLADALLAAGLDDEAAGFIGRWQAEHPETDAETGADLALIGGWLAERRGDWRAVVAALSAQAEQAEGATCANLWARVGEILEVRLLESQRALAAYEAALDADPANPAARDGFVRLGPAVEVGHAGGPWSERARAAPNLADRQRILAAEAAQLPEGPARDGMLTVAGQPRGESVEARSARSATAGRARTAAVRAVAHAVAAGDPSALAAALEALRAEALASPLVALACRRLAQLQGDDGEADLALEGLTEALRSPTWRAAALRARVARLERAGEDGEEALAALEAAVLAAPDDGERAQRLAERLIAEQAWSRLEALYDAQASVAATFDERLALARARAGLRAERFDDVAGAYAILAPFLAEAPNDADTALRAAQYAERAGDHAAADGAFDVAFQAEEGALKAALAHARALEARGDPEGALLRLEEATGRLGEDRALLELQAEVRSRLRDWSGVVRTLLRLLEVEPTPAAKAHRAMAIGRILSRVVQDHRRAAGWFKRAVELDADQLKAVWLMLAEIEQLPAEDVPADHVEDALVRAIEAVRVRLAASPSDVAVLQDLFRLQRARGDRDGERWAAEALRMLGADDERVQAALAERPRRLRPPQAHAPERIAWLLVHRREARPAGVLFALTAPALRVALGQPPTGPSVDGLPIEGRAWLEAWGAALGVEDLCMVEGELGGGYDPAPVLRVPRAVLQGQAEPGDLFDVGCTLEGLRDGRLLAARLPADALEAAVRTVAVASGVAEASRPRNRPPNEDALRSAAAAARIPVGPLAVEFERAGGTPDFLEYSEAVRASAHRAGLLVCEDLSAAVARVAALSEAAPTDFAVAVERDPAARALYLFALGPAHGALRRALGLGEGAR